MLLEPWDRSSLVTRSSSSTCQTWGRVIRSRHTTISNNQYTSKDTPNPRGEICLRGSNICPGYLHDPVNTAKLLDKDGWMHTEE